MATIETKEIKLALLDPPKTQARFAIQDSDIEDLAASIREVGLLQPLIVRKTGKRYTLVAGNRRWAALGMLGMESAACRIIDTDTNTAGAITVTENLQRQDLNPVEEAIALQELKNTTGWSDAEIGLKLGKRREYVTRQRSLLDLDEKTLDALVIGRITPNHAYELRRIEDPERRDYWRHWTIEYGATVRQLRDWIKAELQQIINQPAAEPTDLPTSPPVSQEQYVLSCELCGATQNQTLLKTMWICQEDYATLKQAMQQQEKDE